MCINPPRQTTNTNTTHPLDIGSEAIEEVEKFIYLGGVVTKNGSADEDVRNRIR